MTALGSSTSPVVGAGTWTVLVPVGSTEQHGPHLPLDTDTRVATAVATGAATRRPDTLVAPVLAYGASGEHAGFAGTLSLGSDALTHCLVELGRSAGPEVERLVLVNGHGGNRDAVDRAVDQLQREGRPVQAWWPQLPGADAHAGRTETSLLLAIAPDTVHLAVARPGRTEPLADLLDDLRSGGLARVTPNGVLGDPTGASEPEGRRLLDDLVDDLLAALGVTVADHAPPVAVVTGAARGIGAATARRLDAAGWRLVLVDACRDDPALAYPLADRAELDGVAAALDGDAVVAQVDVRDVEALRRTVAGAVADLGRLDAAVACAGAIAGGRPAWQTSPDVWRTMVDVNLGGVWNLAGAALPAMTDAGHGRFVAVASAASVTGLPMLAAYTAAKHGVVGLVRALAAELGPLGVTANAVLPGSTRTAMLDASAAVYDLSTTEAFAEHHRTGRLVEPDEVAAVVAWLCTDAPASLTGTLLPVDGGMTSS